MRFIMFFWVCLTCICGQALAASVIYSYDDKGVTNGILGITGITQESSWRCRENDATLCSCPTTIYGGTIAQIDYQVGSAISEGFVLETVSGSQYISLGREWSDELGTADSSWIPKLIRKGERVLIVAESCGVSGQNVIGRDIFSFLMLDSSMRNERKSGF